MFLQLFLSGLVEGVAANVEITWPIFDICWFIPFVHLVQLLLLLVTVALDLC